MKRKNKSAACPLNSAGNFGEYATIEAAIEAWNRRHEPNIVHQFEGDNDEIISFIKRSLSAGKNYKAIIQEL